MRYLLKKDEFKYNRIIYLLDSYFDYRIPNKLKQKSKCQAQLYVNDIDQYIISELLNNKKIEIKYVIKDYLKNLSQKHIINDFEYQKKNDYYIIKADFYDASDSYINLINSIDKFDKLKNIAYKEMYQYSLGDMRNLVEKQDKIYLGIREINKKDQRLLGDLIDYEFIMSSKEYDKILTKIKYEYL